MSIYPTLLTLACLFYLPPAIDYLWLRVCKAVEDAEARP